MRAVALVLAGVALAGCSSTREKAATIKQQGSRAFQAAGLRLNASDRAVRVGTPTVLRDQNGTAVVVQLRNTQPKALGNVPVGLTVEDATGKPIWRNDSAGIQTSLASVAYLPPGKLVTWVNDQVLPVSGVAAKAQVLVGTPKLKAATVPALTAMPPAFEGDPVDGVSARGLVANGSGQDLENVVVTGVSVKGGRAVAAGRAVVPRVKAHTSANYVIFFIGDPRGGQVDVAAAPSALGGP